MRYRIWLVLVVAVALLAIPSRAYAADGFIGGLQDFVGARDVDESLSENGEKEPALRAVVIPPPVLPDDAGMLDYIQYFIATANRVPVSWDQSRGYSLLEEGEWLIRAVAAPLAVLLVFFWWGVRKAIRVIFASFRKGRINA